MGSATGGGGVLGVSFDFHDAAAALVVDGSLVAAAEEERFSRTKHDPELPLSALRWCLDAAGVGEHDLDAVAYYEKPFAVLERVVATHASVGPRGLSALAAAMSVWPRRKLWVGYRLERALASCGRAMPKLIYCEHHQSHASAAFYPSPFERSAILVFDAVGEWATSSIAHGSGRHVRVLEEQRFPDSIGLFYSALTAFCGFAVNDGEYKLMGLAPYGQPKYVPVLSDRVIDVRPDGSIRLDQRWFDYRAGRAMTRSRLGELLDGPPRSPADEIGQREADIAASAQFILEEVLLRTARHAHALTGERAVCIGGGVGLNCVANARLLSDGPFEDVWVQPAAGDAGSAAGAAFWATHELGGAPREPASPDGMRGAALGPAYGSAEVASWLDRIGIAHRRIVDPDRLYDAVAAELASGSIVGWFDGPMEFGPRALGRRSILADPRDPEVVGRLNRLVKGREGFRPFGPAVMAEHAAEWFVVDRPSPYMTFTAAVHPERVDRLGDPSLPMAERLADVRSQIPAVTHVDGSSRVQTVDRRQAPEFHGVLDAFRRRTGVPVLVNTSFNRRDEPIVRSPADALACAARSGLDLLALQGCLVAGSELEDVTCRAR